MKDETFLFHSDCRDKKNIARSARNKRTHNGKSGGVKFPSDYMTKKEIKAMSGEVKSYKLNEPMSWKEFKAMPDDIKVTYIKLLREKFIAFDSAIAEMMGINNCSFSQEMKRLGLNTGHRKTTKWDKEAFYAWAHGVPVKQEEPIADAERQDEVTVKPVPEETIKPIGKLIPVYAEHETFHYTIPKSGSAYYEGNITEVLNSVRMILGNANVKINIAWEMVEDGK
jgi:hypothetical protein